MFNCLKMTVQNYIGQFQQNLDTGEVNVMIYDRVEEVLMDIFSEGDTGQGISTDTFYTKSQIDTKLSDYLTKSSASGTYATKTSLNDYYNKSEIETKLAEVSSGGSIDLSSYLTKTEASNTYATDSEVAEAVEALNNNVQTNYLSKSDASTTYANKTSLNDYYNKSEIDTKIANVGTGGSADLSNY